MVYLRRYHCRVRADANMMMQSAPEPLRGAAGGQEGLYASVQRQAARCSLAVQLPELPVHLRQEVCAEALQALLWRLSIEPALQKGECSRCRVDRSGILHMYMQACMCVSPSDVSATQHSAIP